MREHHRSLFKKLKQTKKKKGNRTKKGRKEGRDLFRWEWESQIPIKKWRKDHQGQ